MAEDTLKYKIDGDASGLKKSLSEAFESTKQLEEGIKKVAEAIGLMYVAEKAFEFLKDGLKESFNAFKESQLAAHDLAAAVNTSGGLGKDFKELQEQAEKLSQTGTFSAKEIERAQTMALQTGLVSEQVKKLIPIAADLSAKLLNPQGAKMNLDEIQGHIDKFLKTGKDKALKLVGAEGGNNLEERLAILQKIGLAAKGADANLAATTLDGTLKNLHNRFESILETVGSKLNDIFKIVLPYISKIFDGVKTIFDWFGNHSDAFVNIFKKAEAFIQPFIDLFKSAFNQLEQPVLELAENILKFVAPLIRLFNFLKPYFLELGNGIIAFEKVVYNLFSHIFKIGYSIYQILDKLGLFKVLGKIFDGVWQTIKSIGGYLVDIYNNIIEPIFSKLEKALDAIKKILHISEGVSTKDQLVSIFAPNSPGKTNDDGTSQTFGGIKLSPDLAASSATSSEKTRESITLNIDKLVEHLDIHSTTIEGSKEDMIKFISEALQQAVYSIKYAGH